MASQFVSHPLDVAKIVAQYHIVKVIAASLPLTRVFCGRICMANEVLDRQKTSQSLANYYLPCTGGLFAFRGEVRSETEYVDFAGIRRRPDSYEVEPTEVEPGTNLYWLDT